MLRSAVDGGLLPTSSASRRDDGIAEFWRSGGATGAPLFYPRSFRRHPLRHGRLLRASIECAGCRPADRAHVSFPLGIHPVGPDAGALRRATSASRVNWAGAGAATPSAMQIELIAAAEADDLDGHEQLRPASRQSRRGARASTSPASSVETHPVLGRAAVGRQAREARAALGRAGARHVRHDRSRHDGRRGASGRAASASGPTCSFIEVLDPKTSEPVPEGEIGTPGGHAALDQQRHAVPALELRRLVTLPRARRRRRPVLGVPAGQARAPHHRLLQGARRQHQPCRVRGLHVPRPRGRATSRRS